MKRVFIFLTICVSALALASCNKEDISPEYLDKNPSKAAEIRFASKGEFKNTITMFRESNVYRKSEFEGQSWFYAFSGGKMVYEAFALSIYFDNIDTLNVGDVITPSRCWFSFIYSSNSNATAHEYEGKITIADKGEDYVIIDFHKVIFDCSFGKYTIDGYLECPLYEQYVSK